MKFILSPYLIIIFLLLSACSDKSSTNTINEKDKPSYYVLDEQLSKLRADFNSMDNKLRLVFISGPTCGICLRGLDDLNKSIVNSIQNDPRIHTLVIHVPTLDAEAKHAVDAIPLMSGPRVTHYWDQSGRSGLEFQTALGISIYAWDIWMIYEPGALWPLNQSPPAPAYWEHQLRSLPKNIKLDADRFAGQVKQRLEILPPITAEEEFVEEKSYTPEIITVMQPRGVIIKQHHLSRGGYQKIKLIEAIHIEGEMKINGDIFPLSIETSRPNFYKRIVNNNNKRSVIVRDGTSFTHEGEKPGMPIDLMHEMLKSYDFDGWMTDFKDKGYKLWRLGMKKVGDKLPWLMEVELLNGQVWHLYIDSHTGDQYRTALLDRDGNEALVIEYDDFKDVNDYRLPHQVRYIKDNELIAIDNYSSISLTITNTDNKQ